jgi:hypothetical protein
MTSPSEAGRARARPPAVAETALARYLAEGREIARLCTQNGWIDDTTLAVDVVERGEGYLVAAVTFEEVIMEGAGCVAGRVPCYGRVRATLGNDGEVRAVDVI